MCTSKKGNGIAVSPDENSNYCKNGSCAAKPLSSPFVFMQAVYIYINVLL